MNESISNIQTAEPQNRTTGALVLFLFFALPMPFCLFIYHYILWTNEQNAIASLSLKNFAWAGPIGLAVQAIVITGITAALWYFTRDDRFKPVYAGLFGASAMAFPALILHALGPNNDQPGSIVQFILCAIGAGVVIWLRKNKFEWDRASLPFGLVVAGIGFAPFVIYGSFGSFGDVFLSLLASIAFGFFAATLIESTTGNLLLDGVGIGAVLALLGSSIGYDGSQLLLLAILPSFAFAISALMPSRLAAGAATSLLVFAGLTFFDPTELTIVLGDIFGIAVKTIGIVILIGLVTSLIALILRFATGSGSKSRTKRAAGWAGAGVVWMFVIALFFMFGNPGNYGDRLFVIMKDQADISDVVTIKDRDERLNAAYEKLTEHANETQADLHNFFDKTGVKYTPYYLENAMEVRGGTLVRLYLMTRSEVGRIIPSPRLRPVPEDSPAPGYLTDVDGSVQWNISMIGADKVWNEFHAQGEGIVVGNSDSGVDRNHPAIHDQYRGVTQGDDYNWFDPWDGTTSPNDEGGHGTHTTGTILGANGIGVAPKAQWIGCVNLDRNLANPAFYLDCMQFMLAPFPHGGDPFKDGDPGKAAHVLNNSWGCPASEGCVSRAELETIVNNTQAAGIFVEASAGNSGSSCSTVSDAPAIYSASFSTGAIDINNALFRSWRYCPRVSRSTVAL